MKERSITFKIGTFNVRTLQSETKQQHLADDITNYRLDVLCLQDRLTVESKLLKPYSVMSLSVEDDEKQPSSIITIKR